MESDRKMLEQGFKIFKWTKAASKLIGLWPSTPNYYLFQVYMIYITFISTLQLIYLYKSLENIKKSIDIMTETIAVISIYTCILMLRVNNRKIGQVMTQAVTDYNISAFRDSDEVEVFMQFINKARFLLKVLIIYMALGEILWYIRPLMALWDNSIEENNKTLFVLPYEIWLFYEIDSTKYYLTYLFLMPVGFFFSVGNISANCFLISLVFYTSGKMAVLKMRIDALESDQQNCRNELRQIISEHGKLLQMGDKVRDAYSVSLLVYFVTSNFILCIVGYQALISAMANQFIEMLEYLMYLSEMYLMLALFCMISEHLTSESLKCGEAFYTCKWYNFPLDCSKDIILCIERSQKPLSLTAGKFTTFSSVTLTDVSKTALGYLSLLRNFLIVD